MVSARMVANAALRAGLALLAAGIAIPRPAMAASAAMSDGGVVMPPMGWLGYCSRHNDEPSCHAIETPDAGAAEAPLSFDPAAQPASISGARFAVSWLPLDAMAECGAASAFATLACSPAMPSTIFADALAPAPPPATEQCADPATPMCQAELLTPARARELKLALKALRRLPAVDDETRFHQRDYWEAADANGGDCEDFALAARAALIRKGWARPALRLATTWTEKGAFHVVLTVDVRRDNGALATLVLDRRYPRVESWQTLAKAGYRFVSRQSAVGPAWVDLAQQGSAVTPPAPAPAQPATDRPRNLFLGKPLNDMIAALDRYAVAHAGVPAGVPTITLRNLADGAIPAPINQSLTLPVQHGGVRWDGSTPWTFQVTTPYSVAIAS